MISDLLDALKIFVYFVGFTVVVIIGFVLCMLAALFAIAWTLEFTS